MRKRGAVQIQFNWIFVLVIGAIIIVSFTTFIMRAGEKAKESNDTLIIKNLETILAGSVVSTGTANIVKIPQTTIGFGCNEFSIGDFSQRVDVMTLFAPSKLEGNSLITLTLDWSMPFRVTNLLYVTNPSVHYAFIGGDNAEKLRAMMPNTTSTEVVSSASAISDAGEGQLRIVSFGSVTLPSSLTSSRDDQISALEINGDLESGSIAFKQKSGNSLVPAGNSQYLGAELLLGAVYADDPGLYECSLASTFKKLNIVSNIYRAKTLSIRQAYSSGDRCGTIINDVYSLVPFDALSSALATSNTASVLQEANNIRTNNKQAQLQSCAVIY